MSNELIEATMQSKHGLSLDITQGDRRTHVRVFEYEESPFEGSTVELPVSFDKARAIDILRRIADAMEASGWPEITIGERYREDFK